jgi:DNA topoisomerase VI subunit A
LDHVVGIERDLSTTQQEIDDCTQSIAAMSAVIQVLRHGITDADAGSLAGAPLIKITRRNGDSINTTPATETTTLLPGDVVRVELDGNVATQTATSAQQISRPQN